ncbi:Putative ribosome biogenesis GTPase RsgA [Marinomonas aquimarina]|uniref:Putative ribosome biogenesis GTPase RsgA n=1 Tax=Marinomonas aquimarina TaxID=295068 RepID=A0A1A8T9H4_9GAMM|nr:GTPase RsgA [Marinomonas aquimarina]SBS28642.1 Putative ribosome biogenesis GTPase RsgA [Marinomonas aquimarina]
MDASISLFELGWQTYFQQQLSLDDLEAHKIARVCQVEPSNYALLSEQGLISLAIQSSQPKMTIGDWVIVNSDNQFVRKLDRSALFNQEQQLIASNMDTVLIVSALDDNFNIELIKRYLELVHDAEADAIVVLTKADLCDEAEVEVKRDMVQRLNPLLMIETVNSKSEASLDALKGFFKKGKTIAILGAPGAGKSRLVRSLIDLDNAHTNFNVAQDSLFRLPNGSVLLDSPALRELQANEAMSSVSGFEMVAKLAEKCRFNDCTHTNEPGCAVRKAIDEGELEEQRVQAFKRANFSYDDDSAARSKPHDKFHRSAHSDARARKHSLTE